MKFNVTYCYSEEETDILHKDFEELTITDMRYNMYEEVVDIHYVDENNTKFYMEYVYADNKSIFEVFNEVINDYKKYVEKQVSEM